MAHLLILETRALDRSTPPAVYAVDAPLADLRTAELLLTATLRLFAAAWSNGGEAPPDWRGGLLRSGAATWAAAAFEGLMEIVVAARRRPLDVRCLACPSLSPDEGRFLQIISLAQHRRFEAALKVLGEWLPPSARRLALPPAEGLGRALAKVGLIVPWRHAEAARLALGGAGRGLMFVQ